MLLAFFYSFCYLVPLLEGLQNSSKIAVEAAKDPSLSGPVDMDSPSAEFPLLGAADCLPDPPGRILSVFFFFNL